ncbi:hypothetical protein ACVV2G_22795 [Streptomyces ziwulingensis]
MDTLVTVIVLLAVIAAGAFLIHRLNAQHGDRIAAFHYRRDGVVAPDREPPAGQSGRHRTEAAHGATEHRGHRGGDRDDRRDGRRVRLLRPRRRTHGKSA